MVDLKFVVDFCGERVKDQLLILRSKKATVVNVINCEFLVAIACESVNESVLNKVNSLLQEKYKNEITYNELVTLLWKSNAERIQDFAMNVLFDQFLEKCSCDIVDLYIESDNEKWKNIAILQYIQKDCEPTLSFLELEEALRYHESETTCDEMCKSFLQKSVSTAMEASDLKEIIEEPDYEIWIKELVRQKIKALTKDELIIYHNA